MTNTRVTAYTSALGPIGLYVSDCADCGVVFAMTEDLKERRRQDHRTFYCPNGHSMSFRGKTDKQKLDEARARETALEDQLRAAIREGENTRTALLRDRTRFANGVCPCCNRSFANVRRHINDQHPDYDVTKVKAGTGPKEYRCGCGQSFDTWRGLRIHQGWARRGVDWENPRAHSWQSHLTEVTNA